MASTLDRPDTETADLAEPYGSLLAFLSDIDEQADQMRAGMAGDPTAAAVLNDLKARLTALALVVTVKATETS